MNLPDLHPEIEKEFTPQKYFCGACMRNHNQSSKIGKAHSWSDGTPIVSYTPMMNPNSPDEGAFWRAAQP